MISDKSFYGGIAVLYAVIFALAGFYHTQNYKVRFYSEEQSMAIYAVGDRMAHRCKAAEKQLKVFKSCYFGEEHKNPVRRVLLAGNSHADALKPAFIKEAEGRNINFYLMRESLNPGQAAPNARLFIEAIRERSITDFVFHGRINTDRTYQEMENIIREAKGVRIHIIDPVPAFPVSVPMDVYTGGGRAMIDRKEYDRQNAGYFQWRRSIKKAYPQVRFYDTAAILCPAQCLTVKDGRVLYIDKHHLNVSGAYLMRPIVRKIYSGQ